MLRKPSHSAEAQLAIAAHLGKKLDTRLNEFLTKCRSGSPPHCQAACPLHLDVKGYVGLMVEGKWAEALAVIRKDLPFPGILGRVCDHPCETKCWRNQVDHPVAICALKRFIADREGVPDWDLTIGQEREEKVAIIGSGPAGLMASYELRKKGYRVTIFEARSQLGGMLRYGIPEYRLPREVIEKELKIISALGIECRLNTPFGANLKLEQLFAQGYQAVFLALGAHRGVPLNIGGEDAEGMVQGVDFLREINTRKLTQVGHKLAVIGGGHVAMDVARSARRCGALVTLIYRRTVAEMPAREEVPQALLEGVQIEYLATPKEVLINNGRVAGLRCARTALAEPDESGRRRPASLVGSDFDIGCDTLVVAIGQRLELPSMGEKTSIKLTRWGTLEADPLSLATGRPGVFGGGDARTGPRTVVEALAEGRKAAASIDRFIRGADLLPGPDFEAAYSRPLEIEIPADMQKQERTPIPVLTAKERDSNFREVVLGYSEEQALSEAQRCLSCECLVCQKNCEFLRSTMNPRQLAEKLKEDLCFDVTIPSSCNLCNLCGELCPEGLDVGSLCLEIRKHLSYQDRLPLPQHKPVLSHQRWGSSRVFTLAKANRLNKEGTPRVFFPGCTLAAYSPDLITKTFEHLRSKLPGTGIILNCCGGPSHLIGEMTLFRNILDGIDKQMKALGASEIITACAKCYHVLKVHAPQWKIRGLYEVLVEVGLPERSFGTAQTVFSIHDSCAVRHETKFRESVREVMQKLECRIEEMEFRGERTRCCGGGGMIAPVNPPLFERIARLRVEETPHDIVTYCAGCRENFAQQEKGTLHLLDLVFNSNWHQDRAKPPRGGLQRWKNRWALKRRLNRM